MATTLPGSYQPHKRPAQFVTTLDILSGLAGGATLICLLTVAFRFGGRVDGGTARL